MFASTGESRTKATMCVIPPGTKTPNKSIPEADHRLWPRSGIWQLDSSDCTASRKSKKLPNGWPATVIAPYHCSLPSTAASLVDLVMFVLAGGVVGCGDGTSGRGLDGVGATRSSAGDGLRAGDIG